MYKGISEFSRWSNERMMRTGRWDKDREERKVERINEIQAHT